MSLADAASSALRTASASGYWSWTCCIATCACPRSCSSSRSATSASIRTTGSKGHSSIPEVPSTHSSRLAELAADTAVGASVCPRRGCGSSVERKRSGFGRSPGGPMFVASLSSIGAKLHDASERLDDIIGRLAARISRIAAVTKLSTCWTLMLAVATAGSRRRQAGCVRVVDNQCRERTSSRIVYADTRNGIRHCVNPPSNRLVPKRFLRVKFDSEDHAIKVRPDQWPNIGRTWWRAEDQEHVEVAAIWRATVDR